MILDRCYTSFVAILRLSNWKLPVVLFLIWPICCAKWCLRSLATISLQCLLESKQDFCCRYRFHQLRRGVRSGVQLNCTETRFQKCSQRKQYKTIKKLLSLETPAPPLKVPDARFLGTNFETKNFKFMWFLGHLTKTSCTTPLSKIWDLGDWVKEFFFCWRIPLSSREDF